MAKVNKAYSLDVETVQLLENYCSAYDNWDKRISRSKVVNDAIRWFIIGDVAELKADRDDLQSRLSDLINEKHSSKVLERTNLPWWRRLLLGQ
jgi:hypothetical protein